jgi:hypothetical protein
MSEQVLGALVVVAGGDALVVGWAGWADGTALVGTGGVGAGWGVVGCAAALTANAPSRSTIRLSASTQPARRRRSSCRCAVRLAPAPTRESITRTVGGALAAIAQAPTIPLRISTTSGASAARP